MKGYFLLYYAFKRRFLRLYNLKSVLRLICAYKALLFYICTKMKKSNLPEKDFFSLLNPSSTYCRICTHLTTTFSFCSAQNQPISPFIKSSRLIIKPVICTTAWNCIASASKRGALGVKSTITARCCTHPEPLNTTGCTNSSYTAKWSTTKGTNFYL